MKKITKLTEAQKIELITFREEYLAHGRSTEPADRSCAEAAFGRAYEAIGRKPVPIIWVASPLAANLFFHWARRLQKTADASLVDSLRDSLWDSLRASLRASIEASIEASIGASLGASLRASLLDRLWDRLQDSLRDSLWDSLRASLGASLRASIEASIGASLRASLWDSLGDSLGASLGASLRDRLGRYANEAVKSEKLEHTQTNWWGGHDLYWVAFHLFCQKIGVKYEDDACHKLQILDDIGKSCLWWYPRDGVIVACDRPSSLKIDDRGRLHSGDGPSMEFRDGWKLWRWHGVPVPGEWIENKSFLTAHTALAETNMERRRAACEILGWDRILTELSARTIDADPDPQIGTLLEVDMPDAPRSRFLRVLCGTGRQFAIPVPPDIPTALAANAWTYDIPVNLMAMKEHRT